MDYIKEVANESLLAMGKSSPNPPVGAIIVSSQNKIIGRGHTQNIGGNHAEIEAINNATESLTNSTLYTTLEPCNITGNTPPCTEAIIKNKITHVVICQKDPNPKINGNGIKILNENNVTTEIVERIEIVEYALEAYNHFTTTKTPFFTLKLAMSLDGKLATNSGNSKWISGIRSRELVHQYRSDVDAIVTGIGTVIKDNPQLNVRLENINKSNQPKKIILDTNGRIPINSQCIDSNTIIICSNINDKIENELLNKSVTIEKIPKNNSGSLDLKYLNDILIKHKLINIFVECGPTLSSELIKLNLIQKLLIFISPKVIGGSKYVPFANINSDEMSKVFNLKKIQQSKIGEDILIKGWF